MLTLGPHAFLYFQLTVRNTEIAKHKPYEPPLLLIKKQWLELLHYPVSSPLLNLLAEYLYHCRWFKSKTEKITQVRVVDQIELMRKPLLTYLFILQIEYKEAEAEHYLLPLTSVVDQPVLGESSQAVVAQLQKQNGEREWLVDALFIPEVCHHLFSICKKQRQYKGTAGKLRAQSLPHFRKIWTEPIDKSQIKPMANEQSNTSINYANTCILKLFRRIEIGINPDVEINRYLTQKETFTQTASLAATIEYQWRNHTATLAHIQQYVPHQTDAWNYTLDAIGLFFESALSQLSDSSEFILPNCPFHGHEPQVPDHVYESLGSYAHSAHLMGIRTAELHLTLGSETKDPYFQPEPFTLFDQKALHQSIHYSCRRVFEKLAKKVHTYEDRLKNDVITLLDRQQQVFAAAHQIVHQRIDGKKIRCHGDYHLGQILYTGQDFVLIDFEGEPERSLTERQIKRSSLRDVAGLLRSLHYAISKIVLEKTRVVSAQEQQTLEQLADYWYGWCCQLFLKGYREKAEQSHLLPRDATGFYTLLRAFLIERAAYEIDYELNNRSNLIHIPCRGMLNLMDASHG